MMSLVREERNLRTIAGCFVSASADGGRALFEKRNELLTEASGCFAERKLDPAFARQRVDDEGIFRPLYFFEQQRGLSFPAMHEWQSR